MKMFRFKDDQNLTKKEESEFFKGRGGEGRAEGNLYF